MSDLSPLSWVFIGLMAIAIFGTIIGSVVHIVFFTAFPIFLKIVWSIAMVILSLVILLIVAVSD